MHLERQKKASYRVLPVEFARSCWSFIQMADGYLLDFYYLPWTSDGRCFLAAPRTIDGGTYGVRYLIIKL